MGIEYGPDDGTLGTIVLYRLNEGRHSGEYRPAIIVRRWIATEPYTAQLQVFTDNGSDTTYNDELPPVMWKTSITRGDNKGQYQLIGHVKLPDGQL